MSIAESMTGIAENIITSYNTRAKDNHQMLQEFAQERQRMNRKFKQMSAAQAENLAGFVESLSRNVKSLLHGFHQDRVKRFEGFKKNLMETVKEIIADTRHNLKKFKQARSQMSEQQKEALASNAKDRAGEVKKILSASRGFISKCGEDMNKAANIWRNMTSTLAKARNGARTTMVEESPEKVKSHKKGKRARSRVSTQ